MIYEHVEVSSHVFCLPISLLPDIWVVAHLVVIVNNAAVIRCLL